MEGGVIVWESWCPDSYRDGELEKIFWWISSSEFLTSELASLWICLSNAKPEPRTFSSEVFSLYLRMFYLFFLLFILLCLALFFSVIRTGSFRTIAKVFRIAVVVISSAVFIYLFTKRSLSSFKTDSLTVQVINQLPMPLDFYLI